MFRNKIIAITGGTGSFGKACIPKILKKNPKEIRIFSRDEMKQWEMVNLYKNNNKVKFFIGDVRDINSLNNVFSGVDYVIHAAATKIVPTAEYNPEECLKTNVLGAINVIQSAKLNKIKKLVALSTDKASNPINLYGASKLCSDKLIIASNFTNNKNKISFSVVRYGNVISSRGSVIPFFKNQSKLGTMTITHPDMTRFMINLDQAIECVFYAFKESLGGEIFVSKIPSMKVVDIAKTISSKAKIKYIGIRPGEKIHEQMIGLEDAPYTYEYQKYFKILPAIYDIYKNKRYVKNGIKVKNNFVYSSNKNKKWMKTSELKNWITKNS